VKQALKPPKVSNVPVWLGKSPLSKRLMGAKDHKPLAEKKSDPAESASKAYGFGGTAAPKGKRRIFDDDFLDELFPRKKTYYESAPKRKTSDKPKARGFAYLHGTKADESGSEEE
jgi:hypothetical protein